MASRATRNGSKKRRKAQPEQAAELPGPASGSDAHTDDAAAEPSSGGDVAAPPRKARIDPRDEGTVPPGTFTLPQFEAYAAPAEDAEVTQISARRPMPSDPAGDSPDCVIVISHPDPAMLGRRYAIEGDRELVIGRSADVGICLDGVPAVSRRHARLFRSAGAVLLDDLGSRNGTFMHGERLLHPVVLRHGDQFAIDAIHFRFVSGTNVEHAFHETIYDLVTHDDLTGAFNRRKFEKEVEREFLRARRHGRDLSVVVFDIDGFKGINDRHGHPCGDWLLQQLVALVTPQIRKESLFARIGGDEFVVLCPEVSLAGARTLAERLRLTVESHEFRFEEETLRVTSSFGTAELTPEMNEASELYSAADARLYEAKLAGRNRTA